MKGFNIERYTDSHSHEWDDFVGSSKNGTFMLTRKFIGYHGDRFTDASLQVYKKEKLVAVFPANSSEQTIYSHQGLSYGGLVLPKQIKLSDALAAFGEILKYYDNNGFSNLIVKLTPTLYHTQPSDEIQYALFVSQAELYRRDAAICLRPSSFTPNENRKRKRKRFETPGRCVTTCGVWTRRRSAGRAPRRSGTFRARAGTRPSP